MLDLRNRLIAQTEVEQSRGDRASFRVRAPSPKNVVRPPTEFADAMAVLARRRPAVKPANAATVLRVFINVAAAADAVIALPETQAFRNLLIIRNSSTSAGSLLVGLGYPPTSELDCDIELTPGGVLIQDYVVSQDQVWLFSSVGAAASVSYSTR